VASEVRPDPLQSIAQRGGDGPDPRGLGRPSGSWVDFTVADVVATAAEAAARCRREPDAARVVGSFPLALHDLGTFAPGLRGSPRPVRLRAEGSTLNAAIMPFASPAKTRFRLVRSVGAVSLRSGRGPSIARLRVETPLVGLSKDRPSAVRSAWCPLPVPSLRRGGAPSARSLPGSEHVPLLPFLTTSAACSTRRPAGLLHPAAGHGVRRVSSPEARPVSRPSPAPFPRRHTLRSFSLACSRTASPRPLPSRRSFRFPLLRSAVLPRCPGTPLAERRPQGLAPQVESVAARRRCRPRTARCSLGLGFFATRRRADVLRVVVPRNSDSRAGLRRSRPPASDLAIPRGGQVGEPAVAAQQRFAVGPEEPQRT